LIASPLISFEQILEEAEMSEKHKVLIMRCDKYDSEKIAKHANKIIAFFTFTSFSIVYFLRCPSNWGKFTFDFISDDPLRPGHIWKKGNFLLASIRERLFLSAYPGLI
jgi:hypothetical protein